MRRALALAWRLLRAAAGTAVTAALAAGLPWGLARFTGSPLPRNWPGWQQAQRFLASPLSDDAIIRALADAAWLLWAVFALSLAVELIAVARGRPAPRLPAIAPVQALAAALVGATLMTALHAPRTGPRSAQPLHAALTSATVISAPLVPGRPAQPVAAATATAVTAGAATRDSLPAARPRVYRVVEGDDLWDIAERFLGDPEDWHQIYQLNEGKPQPGGRALTDPGLIIPGWVLLLPQPAGPHATTPHTGTEPTTRPGTRAPGGGHPASPSPQPSQPAEPAPRTAGPSRGAPSAGPSSGGSTPSRAAHPGRVAVRLPSGALIGIAVAVMVAAALSLAAVQRRRRYRPRPGPPSSLQPEAQPLPEVIGALRRAARPPAPAAEPDADDPDEDPYLALYVSDAAPAQEPADGPAASPGVQPAHPARPSPGPDADDPDEDRYLDFYDASPSPAPVPDDGRAASPGVQPARPGREPAAAVTARPAQAAGAIPVGVRDDTEVTADIAALGGLGLTGPGADPAARAIIASLLAQVPPGQAGLAAAIVIPAADAARLLPGTDPAAVPGLSVPATLEAALDELEALVLTQARITGALDASEHPPGSPLEPGSGGPGATLVATCAPAAVRRLAAILESGRPLGAAAVLLGAWPAGTTCTVAADGTVAAVTPPGPGLDGVRLFTLGAADAAAITGLLRDASAPGTDPVPPGSTSRNGQLPPAREPQPPAGPVTGGADLPPAGAPRSLAAGPVPPTPVSAAVPAGSPPGGGPAAPEGRPVQLRLLGELRITAGGQEVSGGLRKARELLAFLAVHPDGASGEAIGEALWPEADPARATGQRNLALRKARELLRAATGLTAPMWIINASGRYRLDPALVGTDLQAFGDALDQARHSTGQARLAAARAAVALYDGDLADGAGYEWAEPYAETARRRALDAWTTIAEILQPGDPDEALSALETALAHDPYNEYLYQRIMRLQAAAGRPDAVRRTLALLEARLTDLGITPAAQTRQIAASLLGTNAPRLAAAPGHEMPADP